MISSNNLHYKYSLWPNLVDIRLHDFTNKHFVKHIACNSNTHNMEKTHGYFITNGTQVQYLIVSMPVALHH